MKLSYFSAQTMPKTQFGNHTTKVPKIYFSGAGMILFNQLTMKLSDLEPGDQISIAQDEDNPRDWFFFKDEDHGFELKYSSDKKYLKFNHSALIKAFQTAFTFGEGSRNFEIQKEPVTMKGSKIQYWKILIHD